MIINRKNRILRARPSGKTVCATLAAAGLISLATAVTPAFAQTGNTSVRGNTANFGSAIIDSASGVNSGNLNISATTSITNTNPSSSYSRGSYTVILTNQGNGASSSVAGNLSLGENYLHNTQGPWTGYDNPWTLYNSLNVSFSSDFNIGGNLTTSGANGGAARNVTVGEGTALSVGGNITTGFANFNVLGSSTAGKKTQLNVTNNIAQNITVSGSRVALSVGGDVTGTVTGAIQELSVAAGKTTTLITVTSQNDPGKITSVNGTDSLTLGSTGTQTTIIVGANDFDISTGGAGGLTFIEQLKSDTSGTLNTINFAGNGNLTIGTTGTGNIAFNGGINFNEATAKAYTGTMTINSGGAISTGAASTISTMGNIDVTAATGISLGSGATFITNGTGKNIASSGTLTVSSSSGTASVVAKAGAINVTTGNLDVSGVTALARAYGDIISAGDETATATTGPESPPSASIWMAKSTPPL